MFGYFHDKSYVYVVLEYASNGSLFKKIVQERQFSEQVTAKVIIDFAVHLCPFIVSISTN